MVEWLWTHAALLPVIALLAMVPWAVDVPAAATAARVTASDVWSGRVTDPAVVASQSSSRRRARRRTWAGFVVDHLARILEVVCVVTGITIIAYKVPTGRWMYLAQPCHLQNYLLLWLMAAPKHWASSHALFHL